MDLSILIPARNEMFLSRTIEDILLNVRGNTEIIVALDGEPPISPLPEDPRVKPIFLNQAIGQRAATNLAATYSKAKYVMKCDAHCSFGESFDTIMMEDMQDHWTMVPKMYNLHVFDWVCPCGHRRYQGPTVPCDKCGEPMEREIIWHAKHNPETTAMRFDRDLKFQYWSGYKKRQAGDLVDTMSLLGACWMLTRERYWELDICDEAHGSWGQQGTEVACKTWLSGGRLVCTKKTWFAHMFRTQGGDFGFPYSISNKDVRKARDYSKKLWIENNWDKAIHPLSWLVGKFAPVPDWDQEKPRSISHSQSAKGLVYYTDNKLNPYIMKACQHQLEKAGLDIVSVSLEPISFGRNFVIDAKRGHLAMFRQILKGLEESTADTIFLVEHDVLYHPSHFDFVPDSNDLFCYNQNSWKVNVKTGHALFHYSSSTSGLCANRELLLNHYQKRVKIVEEQGFSRRMGFEPGTHGRKERVDDYGSMTWMSESPNLDIRHSRNLTQSRWHKEQFRNQRYTKGWAESESVPGWYDEGGFSKLIESLQEQP